MSRREIATPKEAAEESPKVKGDAKGFLIHACTAVPDPPNTAPTITAAKARLSLKSQTTVDTILSSGVKIIRSTSMSETLYHPKATEVGIRKNVRKVKNIKVSCFPLFECGLTRSTHPEELREISKPSVVLCVVVVERLA